MYFNDPTLYGATLPQREFTMPTPLAAPYFAQWQQNLPYQTIPWQGLNIPWQSQQRFMPPMFQHLPQHVPQHVPQYLQHIQQHLPQFVPPYIPQTYGYTPQLPTVPFGATAWNPGMQAWNPSMQGGICNGPVNWSKTLPY